MWLLDLILQLRFFIGHVKNSFPKPLSKNEEKTLLQRYLQGDTDAYNKLIEHNMRLVAHIAKKYSSSGYENDDLISIGSIGLIKAVKSYNTDKSTHLATYASRCIENEILMHLRANKKRKSDVSLSDPIGTDKEGNEVTLIDVLKSDDEEVDVSVNNRLLIKEIYAKMRRVLDEREQKIIILRFGIGGRSPLTQRETAKRLGISRSYVSRIEKAAMEKLKNNGL
ncbi:MAG: RNA polymerase sporulation sigma factor SigK [Clostridia bacterium]|nr:RNA polymerase sporulation sigma factor SigK [Clostridia bacterium]